MNGDVVHSLGATIAAAALVGVMAARARGWLRARAVRRRLTPLPGGKPTPRIRPLGARVRRVTRRGTHESSVRCWLLAGGAGLALFALVGGLPGSAAGLGAAVAVSRWWRGRASRASADDSGTSRQLPLAGDLLAACLAAGAGPQDAAEAVGRSLGGPFGERLMQVAAELRLGGEPATAWGRLAALPGARGVARCLERAQELGVPAVSPLSRLAADLRADEARRAATRARRAAVLATAPLGLCFLPAFLVTGVAPVLIGLADGLLHGG